MSSLSNSVIRRYTPPTCTLEILAPPSALSRWKKRSTPTQLQHFQLRFDDPRLPEEQRVSISGSRAQLDALHQAVTSYVQDLVNKSPAEFGAMFSAAHATNDIATDIGAATPNTAEQPPQRQIRLQPSKSLSHALSLGTLATPQTEPIVHLSLLQLFDLATALDEYATDGVALPNLKRTRFVYPPAWASIAAVLVATVGVTTAALQYYSRPTSRTTTASTSTQNSINNPQQQIAAPPTIPPLTSLETLPPPSPPAGSIQRVPVPNTTSQLPPTTVAKIPSAALVNPPPSTTPQTIIPQPKQSKITPQTAPTKSPTASKPAAPRRSQVAIIPSPLPQFNSPISPPQTTNPQPIPTFTLPPTQSTLPSSTPTPQSTILPKQPSTPTPTRVPQNLTSLKQPSTPTPTRVPQNLAPPKQPQKTAFDSVPQVAEVREYFQRRWEPSAGVKETLEYSLLLDVDGSIQRIEPLGQAASRYIDRTGMPLVGENFVSPSKNGATPRIRLVLSPDGNVRSFLEPE